MNLKCKINGKEYLLAQGVTFSEEYNETLDSGTIIIPHVHKIENLEPYDDVFIYDNEAKGYGWEKLDYKKDNVLTFEKNQGGQLAIVARIPNLFVQALYGEHKDLGSEIKLAFFQEEEPGFFVTTYSTCHIYKEGDLYYFYIDELNFREELILDENINCWVFKRDDYIWIYNYTDIKVDKFEVDVIYNYNNSQNKFYKHLLVDNISREELNLDEGIYKYTISLFSETKGLECVQLSNFSITEPLDVKLKKNAYDYMVDIVEMYSPIYKVVDNEEEKTWKYKKKYIIDPYLKEIFGNIYVPDFTLTNPNLRDVLSKIMVIKDMIPYVEDGIIKAKDITARTDEFKKEKGDFEHINYVFSNKTSSNYCNSLKTTYSDALSQDNSCRTTEYLSFRNSNSALLTFENLSIETSYPIYKINKMFMCYYKNMVIIEGDNIVGEPKYFLCKQDITPLVKLNSERNVLSEDWTVFNEKNIETVEDLAKFKMSTIGYDIGSKTISGWGQKFTTYLLYSWFPDANSYIEQLHNFMDKFYPYGVYNYSYLREKSQLKANQHIEFHEQPILSLVSPFYDEYPAGLKGLFFEIEYDAFYNGTIYHSKDNIDRDDIVINDNPSNSLTILELDGIAQKEKINRFGNDTFQINARYTDFSQLKPLGTVYNSKNNADNDVVIYSREYSIYDKVINCKYVGAKDYVLKNYFTSVYAKHRPYTLMSYNESIYRSENKKVYVLLDTKEKYIERNNDVLSFSRFSDETKDYQLSYNYLSKILSFIKQNVIMQKNNPSDKDKINYGFFEHNGVKYASDINVFVSGNSLCFNLKMYDNVGAGVYIDVKNLEPFNRFGDFLEVKDDFKGSLQSWYMTVDNQKTGFTEKMGFYVCHVDKDESIKMIVDDKEEIIGKETKKVTLPKYFDSVPEDSKKIDVLKEGTIYRKIFEFPKISIDKTKMKNLIGNEFLVKKDNKELIDMTFQIEPITKSEKIFFSPWMMKLSDLKGNYEKIYNEYSIPDDYNDEDSTNNEFNVSNLGFRTIHFVRQIRNSNGVYIDYPVMILELEEETLNYIKLFFENMEDKTIETSVNFNYSQNIVQNEASKNRGYYVNVLEFMLNQLEKYFDDGYGNEKLFLSGKETIKFVNKKTFSSELLEAEEKVNIEFIRKEAIKCDYGYSGGGGYIYHDSFYINHEEGKIWFVFDTYEQDVVIPNKDSKKPIKYELQNKENKTIITSPTELNDSNASFKDTYLALSKNLSYIQNMFIVASENPIKHYQIYDKYKDLLSIGLNENNVGPIVSKVIYFSDDNILTVDLSGFDAEKTKSIQLWYKDTNSKPYQENGEDVNGTFNFVFGVNVDEKDFEKGKLDIHISMLTHRDMRVFDNLHNVVGEVKNVADISEDSEEYTDKFKQKYVEKTE